MLPRFCVGPTSACCGQPAALAGLEMFVHFLRETTVRLSVGTGGGLWAASAQAGQGMCFAVSNHFVLKVQRGECPPQQPAFGAAPSLPAVQPGAGTARGISRCHPVPDPSQPSATCQLFEDVPQIFPEGINWLDSLLRAAVPGAEVMGLAVCRPGGNARRVRAPPCTLASLPPFHGNPHLAASAGPCWVF